MSKPRFLRRNFACPDCGLFVKTDDVPDGWALGTPPKFFDCPRCAAHYTAAEFVQLNQDKWSTEHQP